MVVAGKSPVLRVSSDGAGFWHLSPQGPWCPLEGKPHLVQYRGLVLDGGITGAVESGDTLSCVDRANGAVNDSIAEVTVAETGRVGAGGGGVTRGPGVTGGAERAGAVKFA